MLTVRVPSLVECLFPRHGALGSFEQDGTVFAARKRDEVPERKHRGGLPAVDDSSMRKEEKRSARTIANIRVRKAKVK